MTDLTEVLRYTAFSDRPAGGNPAGVVLEGSGLGADEMQSIAAAVGYSETAFLVGPAAPGRAVGVRYFAPEGEVPFCGHATIATAAALAEHVAPGEYEFLTPAGTVMAAGRIVGGVAHGQFASPPTGCEPLADHDVDQLLELLRWDRGDLDPDHPPAVGTAANRHPVLVAAATARLADLDYDFAGLQQLCRDRQWITVHLTASEGPGQWRARNPFPFGGVVEDAATGSAAAAFSGYLRAAGKLREGDHLTIRQGVEMGRPSVIEVLALADRARISGPAVALDNNGAG